jgi:hypothetical protein
MTPIDYNDPNEMWRHNGYDPYKGMTDDERMKTGCIQGSAYFLAVIIGMILCGLLFSCKSVEYVPVVEHKTDTLWKNRTAHDSIYVHDSVSVWQKGDTVTIDRWHTKFVKNEVHDTTYISKTDSVPTPYPVIEYKEKSLSWWQKTLMWMGVALAVVMIGGLIVWIVNLRRISILK